MNGDTPSSRNATATSHLSAREGLARFVLLSLAVGVLHPTLPVDRAVRQMRPSLARASVGCGSQRLAGQGDNPDLLEREPDRTAPAGRLRAEDVESNAPRLIAFTAAAGFIRDVQPAPAFDILPPRLQPIVPRPFLDAATFGRPPPA